MAAGCTKGDMGAGAGAGEGAGDGAGAGAGAGPVSPPPPPHEASTAAIAIASAAPARCHVTRVRVEISSMLLSPLRLHLSTERAWAYPIECEPRHNNPFSAIDSAPPRATMT